MTDPRANGLTGWFGNLKLNRSLGLLLHHNRPRGYCLAVADVSHLELYEIAGTEFAIDGEVEQGEFPATAGELQPNADSPDLFQFEGVF